MYGSMQTMYVRVHVDVGFLSRSPRPRRNNRQFFSFQRDHPRVFSSIRVLFQPKGKGEREAILLYERISMVIQIGGKRGGMRCTVSPESIPVSVKLLKRYLRELSMLSRSDSTCGLMLGIGFARQLLRFVSGKDSTREDLNEANDGSIYLA